jgi:hypothetical protein
MVIALECNFLCCQYNLLASQYEMNIQRMII